MNRETPALLWKELPNPRGVFDPPVREERTVFGRLRSVGYRERYEAMAHGLKPELVLALMHDFEYKDESMCRISGVDYRILRTYRTEADGIELTLEREVTA